MRRRHPFTRDVLEVPTTYHRLLTAVVGVTRFLRRDKIMRVRFGSPKAERPTDLDTIKLRVRQLERIEGK